MSQLGVHALSLRVDRADPERLPAQIAEQIRARIRGNALSAGARLPSSRAVAAAVGVSRAVASAAYDQLVAEGWLEARRGAGTYVCAVRLPLVSPPVARTESARTNPVPLDLRPGEPWTPGSASPAWRRAWRDVAQSEPPASYPDPHGLPALREAVAEHLARTRGLSCTPDRVMITNGTTHGLGLLLGRHHRPGAAIAIEVPGYRSAAHAAQFAGWEPWPARIDASGLDPDLLAEAPPEVEAVYATPSHQYPLGVLMPIDRRVGLLEWARTRGAYVIEDDYDSEFRYDVSPLPTLADLDPDRVVYLGTVSKTLGAGVRLGWVVASPALIDTLAQTRERLHDFAPWPTQRALLSLLHDGEWDRMVRAARRTYTVRDRLVAQRLSPYGRLSGVGAGIHTAILLDPAVAKTVAAEAARAGVTVATLDESSWMSSDRDGLVIGYGNVTDGELDFALDVIADCLARTLAG